MVCAWFAQVYARFAQGLRDVYAEGTMFTRGLRKVYAWFTQSAEGLRKVYARFTQGLRGRGFDYPCA